MLARAVRTWSQLEGGPVLYAAAREALTLGGRCHAVLSMGCSLARALLRRP